MPNKSTYLERLSGYAGEILKLYKFQKNDVLLIASNSGRNHVPIEMCLEAQSIGGIVIAITSLQHSKSVASRHVSGKRLFELADIVIDNNGAVGDAAFHLPGLGAPMGATSTARTGRTRCCSINITENSPAYKRRRTIFPAAFAYVPKASDLMAMKFSGNFSLRERIFFWKAKNFTPAIPNCVIIKGNILSDLSEFCLLHQHSPERIE